MNDVELRTWKQRLEHSHSEWRRAGWLPDQQGQNDRYSLARYLDAYRGDYPASLRGATEAADQMVGNITFSIINTMVAQLSGRAPDPILRPIGGPAADADARRRAWLNEQVVEMMIRERKFKREADMAALCAVLGGGGFVRHGYTPEVEFFDDNGTIIQRFKNQTPDMPWLQFMRPWHMRIDTLVDSFAPDSEPRWCAFYNCYFENQVRNHPNLIFRQDLTPTKFVEIEGDRRTSRRTTRSEAPDAMQMYEEWVVYDADERRFFGISPGCEKLIREERDWPFEWGQLPYSALIFNDQIDSPFPIAFPRMFYDEQLLYNRIWTIINALVTRVRRVVFVNKGAINADQMDLLKKPDALMEFIEAEGDLANALEEVGIAPIDGQLVGLLYQLKEGIREVLGVSSFDRGQRANVETAAEAAQIGAGGAIARSRTQERFESFWANLIRVSHRTFLQSEDAREMVLPIIGRENLDFLTQDERQAGFITVTLADLQGEFSYDVKLDSTLRTDPNTELARVSTAYNLLGGVQSQLLNQRHWHERITELGGEDPSQAVIGEQVAGQMAQQSQPGEESPAPTGVESAAQQSAGQGLKAVLGGAG